MTRILLVDDEPLIREVLRTTLVDEGYDVQTAPNGHVALEMMEFSPPDLIITDLLMPHVDGWELITRVRKHAPTLPMILISATLERFPLPDSHVPDHTVFLAKPFDLEELQTIITRLTGS